jgi:hypothetical protein
VEARNPVYIAVLNKMRYTLLATDALCPMPYALCPMPARAPHVTEKGYTSFAFRDEKYRKKPGF